jgi:hypothetical protein
VRRRVLYGGVGRYVPFGAFAGLGGAAALGGEFFLATLLGLGAAYTGRKLLDRNANLRKEIGRRSRGNANELSRVAREDRVAAPQMKRLAALQGGVIESWELLPEEHRSVLEEDVFTVLEEVEKTARLARRRSALRRHLESVDRGEVARRIKGLEKELEGLEPDSPLRAPFESALAGRRGELESYGDIVDGIGAINAQLESAESLLGSLRGELLALDTNPSPHALENGLVRLKERVSLFRRGLDEVARATHTLPNTTSTERLSAG